MKNLGLLLGISSVFVLFTSCKDEKKVQAQKSIDSYVVYVDSLENIESTDTVANWDEIDAAYQMKSTEAENALASLEQSEKEQARLNESKSKYEALKAKMEANMQVKKEIPATTTATSTRKSLKNTFFGDGKVGDDMNFNWVNKNNILEVYSNFVNTAQKNKDSYSREDWDEIKLMYEALDSRKNTVEKEGLSGSDNTKIASLKVQFAPMFTLNRMGAKSDESAKAKK
ncbi:hypothetical protein [Flavobacterium sp.]|uniref:hypothetical protein n=1 Tax=Flavobacterium sp. TaxID=239 RepID=UPI00286B7C2C|nr:hypothetical protein [Flavobacterium sp.]